MEPRSAELTAQNDITTNVGNLVKIWSQTLNTFNQVMFNGSDSSNTELYNAITEGKVLEPGFQEDEPAMQAAIEKALYGFLIPHAWPLSNLDLHPFVV